AKRTGKSYEEVKKLLSELQKMEVLSYLPQTDKPQLSLPVARMDARDIVISEDILKKRKERARERTDAMIHYVESKTKCRSQMLLAYFGETDSYRCGVCDFCIERNKLEMSSLEFETVKEQVKELLYNKPMELAELVNAVRNSKEDKTIKVVQWLVDNEKLFYNEENKLAWKK
ncbi:MAG: hypothetical protein EPN85_13460, partial [Bacteroidetes bacterium]